MAQFLHQTIMPCLPQTDPKAESRAQMVARDREIYQLTYDYHDIPLPKEIPAKENFSPEYQLCKTLIEAQLVQNNFQSDLQAWETSPNGGFLNLIRDTKSTLRHKILNKIWGSPRDVQIFPYNCRPPLSITDYKNILQSITPPIAVQYWQEDWYFAWQRLTGVNPHLLSLVSPSNEKLFEQFPLTNEQFQQAIGNSADNLETAKAEKRLFVTNFHLLDKIPTGISDEWRKYLSAPIGLFYSDPTRTKQLLPIGIQCGQKPSRDNPIFTPASDRYAWLMAKTAFQVADSHYQGIVSHGAYCHIIMGVVAICTYRSLAANHPIRILLHPHFQFTIPIAVATRQIVLSPGGTTPTLQSVTLQGALTLTQRALQTFNWNEQAIPQSLERHGITPEILPEYPYRDDVLLLWEAIHCFVRRYVNLYYTTDADVVGDREVQNWLRELGDRDGGNIHGIGKNGQVTTIKELITLVSQIIHRATAHHAAVNYSVFPAMGFAPNMPGASFAPFPRSEDNQIQYSLNDLLQMLSTRKLAIGQLEDVFVVSNVIMNHIGKYGCNYFSDRRVRPLVEDFQSELDQIEFKINTQNKTRCLPYEILLPSRIPASIHI